MCFLENLTMLQLLKQIVLYVYFLFVRSSKRKTLLECLAAEKKKRGIEHDLGTAGIPAALDELDHLPDKWSAFESFVGFNSEGLCFRLNSRKKHNGLGSVQIDLDIPSYGHFYHAELINAPQHTNASDTDLLGARRTKLFCLDPMRRWKVCFQGPLTHTNLDGKRVHAGMLLFWHSLFDPYDHFLTPSCWKIAGYLSCLSWKTLLTSSLFDKIAVYEQWGELRGRIAISGYEQLNVRLKCIRQREFKCLDININSEDTQQHFLLKESGLAVSQRIMKINSEPAYFGYITFPIGDSHSTTLKHTQIANRYKSSEILKFPKEIKACDKLYAVRETLVRNCLSGVTFQHLIINERPGYGVQLWETNRTNIVEHINRIEAENAIVTGSKVSTCFHKDSEPVLVRLEGSSSNTKELIGGKAYNLAVVKSLGKFNVPRGLVLTSISFVKHIDDNAALNEATTEIQNCLTDLKLDKIQDRCEHAVKVIKEIALNTELKMNISKSLQEVFGKDWQTIKFAVRSSSVNEDSGQTSAAGHSETFLCIQGIDNIISAVQKCWASSFSYQAIEYRRQNGQILLENMGVIIQEMIDSEVSGVVFTVDPVNGDESKIVMNANYGLGTSVVSGEVDCDTFVVDRTDENSLRIVEALKGNKETKTVSDEVNKMQTIFTKVAESNTMCLEDRYVYRICEVAIELENTLSTPVDIEWAISKGKVYILQLRPVTCLVMETDDDLIHEFDNPVVSDTELITPCNIQEMMPGAVSTLTGDLFVKAVDRALSYADCSRLGLRHPTYALGCVFTFVGLCFFNITHVAARVVTGLGGANAKPNIEIQFVGQAVEEHTRKAVCDFLGRDMSMVQKIMTIIRTFVTLKKRDSKLFETLRKKSESLSVGRNCDTATALYGCIDGSLMFYFEMWRAYIFKAFESSVSANVIMMLLQNDEKELNVEALADIALILSDCKDVVSAQVPVALHDLAELIQKSNIKERFLDQPTELCDSFLKNSDAEEIKTFYIQFMEKYGHRGIREADFLEKSWSQDPTNLMETIKMVVIQGAFKKKEKVLLSAADIVDRLQTKLSTLQKLMLKWFLVQSAIDGVVQRERGKSCMMKVSDIFKRAYWRLAELMVRESRIPEPDLLFFLTHREIGQLLKHRSAKLIRLAKRRKKLFPERNKIVFSKVNIGCPQPVTDLEQSQQRLSVFTLKGMPVCRGKAEGRACVVKSLEDASQLRQGDVMICKFTDVGWSPYFPLISGLVTELGGLVSHGAVIARECAIPCIVNIPSATDLIRSGDYIILDGTTGTLSKVW